MFVITYSQAIENQNDRRLNLRNIANFIDYEILRNFQEGISLIVNLPYSSDDKTQLAIIDEFKKAGWTVEFNKNDIRTQIVVSRLKK